MRQLPFLAALVTLGLAACSPAPPAVSAASAGTVTIDQEGGGQKPSKAVTDMADKACSTAGMPARLASVGKAPGGGTQYLYFCH